MTYLDLLDLHQTIPTRAIKKLMQSAAEKAFRCRFVNLSFRPCSFKRISCQIFDCQKFLKNLSEFCVFLWNISDFRMFRILKLLILGFSKAPTLEEVFKTQMRFPKVSISTVKIFFTFFQFSTHNLINVSNPSHMSRSWFTILSCAKGKKNV